MERQPSDRVPELAAKYAEERKSDPLLSDDLEYAGHGGESVVFRVKQKKGREGTHRRLVLKANIYFLKRGLMREAFTRWQTHPFAVSNDTRVRDGVAAMHEQEDDRETMKESIEREASFMSALRRSFPPENLLMTRAVIREVPVTQEIAKEILEHSDLGSLSHHSTVRVPTVVHYQQAIPERARIGKKEEGKNPDMHSFGFRYVERFDIPLEEYKRLNRMTFGDQEPFDSRLLYHFFHVGTVRLLEESYKDQTLADVLRELVHRMIQFTKTTDEMLDMAGSGNVRVFKDDGGKWTYLIVDPFAENEWTGARDATERLLESSKIDPLAVNHLLNVVNYARALNGMARILGIKDRLNLLSGGETHMDQLSQTQLFLLRSRHHWPDKKIFSQPSPEPEKTVVRKRP
ncbi:MAG: hypothetical protein WC654_02850 [Patescibacteria group bacterium]